ncbi:MAG: TIGR03936 family radical SAM-associated protein, partial [Steroidobacteraceae bacterium]|nr:TIGR03936 family radical SAM-associated protein [Steroidobacteraceae bacterium]
MALIGYARVSTEEQDTSGQRDTLRAEGCSVIIEDKASGGSRERPNLARALKRVGHGDTLLVVRIDRLARSLSHLLEIVEILRAKGAYFRSINDPIDTSSPQGMLMTQMLGAFAEFERALIKERTRAGLKAAIARGAKPGNPKMRARDPAAIADISYSLNERYLNSLLDGRQRWLPTVQRLRLRYAKRGRLRFTSTRDFQRAFERALRRTGVPMAYSQGFNPHPRISYANAAPTGTASEAEYVEIAVTAVLDPDKVREALDEAPPPGIDVLEVVEVRTPDLA